MDVTISAGFSGRPYDLRMRIFTIENNTGGNYSRYRGDRYAYSRSGYGSFMSDCRTVDSWIAGHYAGGCYSLPFSSGGDFAGKTIGLGVYDTGAVGHDGNGNVWFTSRIRMLNASIFGSADTGDVGMNGDHIIRPPGAPQSLTITPGSVTTTCFGVNYSRNGESISQDTAQWATDASFNNVVWTDNGPSGFTQPCTAAPPVALTPGTTYYVRVRSLNAAGWGPWSSTISQTTLPANPPSISPVTSLSGTSNTVTMTPPAGGTPSKYTVERRLQGTSGITYTDTTSNVLVVSGLTPGATYEWRASVWYGSYESPVSAWVPAVQANPNTSPGDYFDGSTTAPPGGDVTYGWAGTVNNSTSRANGVSVDGWAATRVGGGVTLAVQRITGGRSGQYAARLIVKTDAPGDAVTIGMQSNVAKAAAVVEGATYVGSIYVRPSRAQSLRADIRWLNGAGGEVGNTQSAVTLVSDTVGWTRLSHSGVAPAGAEFAIVRARDGSGTGWSPWLSGEWMDVDDAMISLSTLFPYFDGSYAPVGEYVFSWEGTPHASPSLRTTVEVASTALIDPDCIAVPAPPRPPAVPNTCIDDTGLWRRDWYTVDPTDVREWFDTIPTLTIRTNALAERQLRIRYYANPFNRPLETIPQDDFCGEIIVSYLPGDSVLTLDGITEGAWASVSGGANMSANHLLYGSGGLPAEWPVLECGIGYYITVDSPTENPAGNISLDFELVTRY